MSQLAEFATSLGVADVHTFSIAEAEKFWSAFLDWSGIRVSGARTPVIEGEGVEHARFFPNLELSYVENLLEGHDPDAIAIVALDETGAREELTRAELSARVRRVAAGLAERGVVRGDRVVAITKNGLGAVVACLAATGLGAIWSSVPPELGVDAIVDRFLPLTPRWLIHDEAHQHHGQTRDLAAKAASVTARLPDVVGAISTTALPEAAPIAAWPRVPWNHPLFILFSSGTTGAPKCIVHGVGGTLLEHVKEHRLHGDLGPADRMLFVTSTGWMMWNWQLSALAAGARILVYDGSVTFPEPDALWRILEREGVTILGTSPAYVQLCRDTGLEPRALADLSALRTVMSTGSVLSDTLFTWITEHIKDVPVQSISGGTDIIGCFALGHPDRPVVPGELQSLSLGYDVRSLHGELICARPFPSRPIGLWNDPDGSRFHAAYFEQNPGVWTHGDFIELTPSGGARILGRSDGILNVRGIRIGPAEIYRALEALPDIREAMALEQDAPDEPGGTRLVLLVVLAPDVTLERPLMLRIKKELSTRCSMNHVPSQIAQVSGLPTTFSGKRSERAARDALNGRDVPNRAALKNPDVLDEIAALRSK